jgi:phosphatidylglycerol:prolipoprotein diacylglycerol transferase
MHRIIFQIGPFSLYSYGLLVAFGFLLATFLILKDSGRFALSRESVFDCLIAILLGGLVGGRLLFVLINWKYYSHDLMRIFMVHEGGLAFQGALAAGIFSGAILSRIKGIPFWKAGDLVAPYIALAQALGRVGCFLNGCCYGKVIYGGIGVTFPGETVMRIPTQIYSSLFLLALFVFLLSVRDKRPFDGYVLVLYLVLYSVFRFSMDFFRGDELSRLFGLTLSQVISIAMFIFGTACYLVLRKGGSGGKT